MVNGKPDIGNTKWNDLIEKIKAMRDKLLDIQTVFKNRENEINLKTKDLSDKIDEIKTIDGEIEEKNSNLSVVEASLLELERFTKQYEFATKIGGDDEAVFMEKLYAFAKQDTPDVTEDSIKQLLQQAKTMTSSSDLKEWYSMIRMVLEFLKVD